MTIKPARMTREQQLRCADTEIIIKISRAVNDTDSGNYWDFDPEVVERVLLGKIKRLEALRDELQSIQRERLDAARDHSDADDALGF